MQVSQGERQASIPSELSNRFKIGKKLAEGATGVLYEAEEAQSRRTGVLKILHPRLLGNAAERQRLKRELVKQATLSSPHLALPNLTGEAGGTLWLFRDQVRGRSLRELLREGSLGRDDVLAIAAELSVALDELHRAGLLHRDLKPEHVIVADDSGVPRAILIDAGIASRIPTDSVFDVFGTVAYVSPEQANGKLVSFRSDLYSLGCLLHELLAGRPPFDGDAKDVLRAHVEQDPPDAPEGLPDEVRALCRGLLQKDPRERPFSAQQVRRTLEPFLTEPVLALLGASGAAPAPSAPKRTLMGMPVVRPPSPPGSTPSPDEGGPRKPPPPPGARTSGPPTVSQPPPVPGAPLNASPAPPPPVAPPIPASLKPHSTEPTQKLETLDSVELEMEEDSAEIGVAATMAMPAVPATPSRTPPPPPPSVSRPPAPPVPGASASAPPPVPGASAPSPFAPTIAGMPAPSAAPFAPIAGTPAPGAAPFAPTAGTPAPGAAPTLAGPGGFTPFAPAPSAAPGPSAPVAGSSASPFAPVAGSGASPFAPTLAASSDVLAAAAAAAVAVAPVDGKGAAPASSQSVELDDLDYDEMAETIARDGIPGLHGIEDGTTTLDDAKDGAPSPWGSADQQVLGALSPFPSEGSGAQPQPSGFAAVPTPVPSDPRMAQTTALPPGALPAFQPQPSYGQTPYGQSLPPFGQSQSQHPYTPAQSMAPEPRKRSRALVPILVLLGVAALLGPIVGGGIVWLLVLSGGEEEIASEASHPPSFVEPPAVAVNDPQVEPAPEPQLVPAEPQVAPVEPVAPPPAEPQVAPTPAEPQQAQPAEPAPHRETRAERRERLRREREEARERERAARAERAAQQRAAQQQQPQRTQPPGGGAVSGDLREQARAHFQARRFPQCAAVYERLTAENPSNAGYFAGLGACRLGAGNAQGAIAAYQRAIQLNPGSSGFYAALGRAYRSAGNRNGAVQAYQRALAINPNNAAARAALEELQ